MRALSLESAPSLTLLFEASGDVALRYVDHRGAAVVDAPISFALEGRAQDSSLTALSATTDGEGRAMARIVAGRRTAAFRIRAMADRAAPVYVDVAVSDRGFGSVRVSAPYSGQRLVERRVLSAFAGMTCADAPRTGVGDRTQTLSEGTDSVRLPALPAGVAYAIVGRAEGSTNITLAHGCVDGVRVDADRESEAALVFDDAALELRGVYDVTLAISALQTMRHVEERAFSLAEARISAGGDSASMLLDALERTLSENGHLRLSEDLRRAREGTPVDAGFAAELRDADLGAANAARSIAETLERWGRDLYVTGALSFPEAADGPSAVTTWSTELVYVGGDVGSTAIRIPPEDLGIDDAEALDATYDAEGETVGVESLRLRVGLGTLIERLLDTRYLPSSTERATARRLAGEAALSAWVAAHPPIAAACPATCVRAASDYVVGLLLAAIREGTAALDLHRAVISLEGTLGLVGHEGDLDIDGLEAPSLEGEWIDAEAASRDPLSISLVATRAAIASPLP